LVQDGKRVLERLPMEPLIRRLTRVWVSVQPSREKDLSIELAENIVVLDITIDLKEGFFQLDLE
jgi:hypothetical protein